MRLSSIINLGKECLILAGLFILGICVFYGFYCFIQKYVFKKSIQIKKKKFIINILLIGYIIVVLLVTLAGRARVIQYGISLELFSSYHYAWNNFSIVEWRNIILNILMFVPLGFLLPLVHESFKTWWKTYLAGLGLTVFIELSQLIFHLGVFEVDDIMNNAVGCMIGFGIYALFALIYGCFQKKEVKILPTLLKQIPTLLTVCLFTGIFMTYKYQEYGNLRDYPSSHINMNDIHVETQISLSDKKEKAYTYQSQSYTQEQCLEKAKSFFQMIGVTIDESLNEYYDETVYFYSVNKTHCISIDYIDGFINYNDFSLFDQKDKGLSLKDIQKILKKYDVMIPDQVSFSETEGTYEIIAYMTKVNDVYLNGTLTCVVNNGKLADLQNGLITYMPYKQVDILSEKEAYQKILDGSFISDYMEYLPQDLIISKVRLTYRKDTKGFMQPVYVFNCITKENENLGPIYIPAIRG
ncbi:VanZ family protein [Longibaculum muris]|uniref:VanZ family protein n=3 Tax=Longibaculum muris TaxID=1796628 RepID=UPI0012B94DE5